MPTENLTYTIPASSSSPAVTVIATLTINGSGLLTGITGTYNGQQIAGVISPGPNAFGGPDDIVTPGGTPFVDNSGIAFSLVGGTGGDDGHGNVAFFSDGGNHYYENSTNGNAASAASLTPACYVRGTMIATSGGEVAVEDLAIGDHVVTVDGAAEPILWIGRRSFAGRFLQGQRHLLPIVFRAGSLADNVPHQDLSVSPAHAMLIDGVLVPAEHLVNGDTIVREASLDSVDYFHIELATHGVVVANGAASETFVDDESRAMFHNVAEFAELYPNAVVRPPVFCAPRVSEGYELAAIRARLNGQSNAGDRQAA